MKRINVTSQTDEYLTEEIIELINKEYERIDKDFSKKKNEIEIIINGYMQQIKELLDKINNLSEEHGFTISLNDVKKALKSYFSKQQKKSNALLKHCILQLEYERDKEKQLAYDDLYLCSFLEIEGEKSVKNFPQHYTENKSEEPKRIIDVF